MPALTFPFVLVTWLLLLATYGFAGLSGTALPAAGVVAPFQSMAATRLDAGLFVQATLLSISQVFLKGSAIAALLFLAGLAVNSVAAAIAAVAGAMLAVITAHALGAESDLVTGGLLGFSPVLTAVALGTVFNKPEPARRGVRGAGHGVHRRCAGGVQRGADAAGHTRAYRAFRAGDVDVPAAAARAGQGHRRSVRQMTPAPAASRVG